MKIRFLGTGTSQGIPVIGSKHEVCLSSDPNDKRMRSSILIQWDQYSYVIDCGPDFRVQMLKAGVDFLNGILFTHFHADHTAGLDDVRAYSQRQGVVEIFADKGVAENIKERFAYIFATKNKYVGAPNVHINKIDLSAFPLGDKVALPIEVMHGNLKIMGFRIDDLVYITDAKYVEKPEFSKLYGVKVLVVNALRIEPHPTHFNLEEALNFIEKVKPKQAYLTHISHRLGFHKEISAKLPEGVHLAYDGLEITL